MSASRPQVDPEIEALWRRLLTHGHEGRWSFLPADPRCMICQQPFRGVGGLLLRTLTNYRPARMSPNMCNVCEDFLPPGGAEVDTAVLFADLRGSTSLAAGMDARQFAEVVSRFYEATSDVLIAAESWIDKLVGDEIMALYTPSMGDDYRRRAVDAGAALLQAVGYEPNKLPWLAMGVGVHAGPAFIGKVGLTGVQQVTALGDTVNIAARIQSHAAPGELLIGEDLYRGVEGHHPGLERRQLTVKGREDPVTVRVLRPADG